MAFKFIALLSTIALANAGLLQEPAVAVQYSHGDYSHGVQSQDILRTHGGTVSQISKQVVSPHSHVTKSVKTVTNDGYKTLSYAAPSYHHYEPQQVHYAAAPQVQYAAAPQVHYAAAPQVHYAAPQVHYAHQEPTYVKSYQPATTVVKSYQPAATVVKSYQPAATVVKSYQPEAYYAAKPVVHAQPLLKSYETAYHQPAAVQYTQAAPVVKTVQPVLESHSTKTVSYSPASAVSHFSYESPIAHYAW
ncbi:uncharacterized protein LOC134837455 [Culicoides brevitarsis]|uniref:uncharacterized protein LOC134837455 n=1 Tax=Culicoides brevitarsis TaxID=469753 RepID=UPI00307BCA45